MLFIKFYCRKCDSRLPKIIKTKYNVCWGHRDIPLRVSVLVAFPAPRLSALHKALKVAVVTIKQKAAYHWHLGVFLKCKHVLLFDICNRESTSELMWRALKVMNTNLYSSASLCLTLVFSPDTGFCCFMIFFSFLKFFIRAVGITLFDGQCVGKEKFCKWIFRTELF